MTKNDINGNAKLKRGTLNFTGLLLLTVLEYVVATQMEGPLIILWIIMLAKAGLIIEYFMHLSALKKINGDGGH